ncbi:MAG: DUF2288 domain-containing protein [Gammaproteobacteria bacterium]|nr:DUF2288 domain-containing protein [Gammaproteobacteria bacterium]
MSDQSIPNGAAAALLGETSRIKWSELARFFAAGKTLRLAPELDLVATAAALAEDNKAVVASLLEAGNLAPVSDHEATAWIKDDALVWAVVVAPWVLVQMRDA